MNHWWLPSNASSHGVAMDRELHLALSILFALVTLAQLTLCVALLINRRQKHAPLLRLELIPFVVVSALFAWMSIRSERLWASMRYAGADPSAMQVEVVGEQFVWYFRYPGADGRFGATKPSLVDAAAANPLGLDTNDDAAKDDHVTGELVLPVNREVDLRIRSLDVIHGFFVPELRIKQNAVPGQTFHIHFTPTSTGRFAILCSQVCGLGHFRMAAQVRVVTADEFNAWQSQWSSVR